MFRKENSNDKITSELKAEVFLSRTEAVLYRDSAVSWRLRAEAAEHALQCEERRWRAVELAHNHDVFEAERIIKFIDNKDAPDATQEPF